MDADSSRDRQDEARATQLELDVVRLTMEQANDSMLEALIDLADSGMGATVGLLVNGMVAIGRLAPVQEMAKDVDAFRRHFAAQVPAPNGVSDEEWEQVTERFATATTREANKQARQRAEDRARVAETLEADEPLSALPRELARRATVHQHRPFLTLADAQIAAPGQSGLLRVSVMRLHVSSVAGWWRLPVDDSGTGQGFQPFS